MTTFLFIRHGIAEDGLWDQPDADRALTPEGFDKTRRAMAGLAARGPIPTLVLSSPYLRARQTRDCLLEALPAAPATDIWKELVPAGSLGAVETGLRALAAEHPRGVIALVGHQPLLGTLVARLTGARVEMKRAAVSVIIEEGGRYHLVRHWLPKQLRGEA